MSAFCALLFMPVISLPPICSIAHVAFEAAMKRNKRLCSVEKSNVLEVRQ